MRLVALVTLDAFVEMTIYPSRRLSAGIDSPRDRFFVEPTKFHLDFGFELFGVIRLPGEPGLQHRLESSFWPGQCERGGAKHARELS